MLSLLLACSQPADLLLVDGQIHTTPGTVTDAIAITDGEVVALGDEALDLDATQTLDLGGRVATAGLHDAHMHALAGSFLMERLLVLGVSSMDALVEQVAAYAGEHPEEPWVIGLGWTNQLLPSPDGRLLDQAVSDRPVLLINSSGHSAVVNGMALAIAGITDDTPDPEGGEIVRDPETGQATGELKEAAMGMVVEYALLDYGDAELSPPLATMLQDLADSGVTSISEILAAPGVDLTRPWLFTELDERGELPLRVHLYWPVFELSDLAAADAERSSWETNRVRFAGAKVWVDGSLSNMQGWTEDAYTSSGEHGSHYFNVEELTEIVQEAEGLGVPLRIHAMGDAAIDAALVALEVAEAKGGLSQQHSIEHAVLTSDVDKARMAALGVVASMQPSHRLAAGLAGWDDELSSWELDEAYDFGGLHDAGVVQAFGTDFPAWPTYDGPVTLWAAVNDPRPGALSVEESLAAYTQGSGQASGMDLGSLEVGMPADLVVWDQDPFSMDPKQLSDLNVWGSWVGGVRER